MHGMHHPSHHPGHPGHPGLPLPLHHGGPPNGGPGGFEFQRISIDRSKMSEEEAFEHAIEMIQTRQMGFRKAADFFSVSCIKLTFE